MFDDSDKSIESEELSMTTESKFSQDKDGRNRGADLKKKLKSWRSIKLSKSPSLKQSTIRGKTQFRNLAFELSSDADNSQKSARKLTRRSSLKLRKPMMRKRSGGSSRLVASERSGPKHDDQSSFTLSSDLEASPTSSKASSMASNGFSDRKMRFQASPHTSESKFGSTERKPKISASSKPKLLSQNQKFVRSLTRSSSLKPKMASSKSKRSSIRKQSETSQLPELSVERGTCSSILKDSKFPESLKLQPGGIVSEGNSVMKVCSFSYCLLHGHRHANPPPLKRFVSMRRRVLKNQKSMKPENRRDKHSSKAKKGVQKRQMVCNGEEKVCNAGTEAESNAKGDVDFLNLVEMLVGETSYPFLHFEKNHQKTSEYPILKQNSLVTIPVECCIGVPVKEEDTVALEHDDVGSKSVGRSFEAIDSTTKESAVSFAARPELSSKGTTSMKEELKDQKYVRMWRLMYKHAVKGTSGKGEKQINLDGVDNTKDVEDEQEQLETNNSGSCQDLSEIDQGKAVESVDAGNQQMENYQNDAIKLVQEAFDEILLPEIREHLSDEQSVTSGVGSDQENEECNIRSESSGGLEEEKTSSKLGDKLERKVSKNWSNLKKILLLKRFVKAVEKVRKLNRREPRFLPLEPEFEAEKVNLRRQGSEERKNAEEWMIDYALQQVISKLAPAQQRKVALLVKAFETVLPLPDLKSSPMPDAADTPRANPVQTGEGIGKESDSENGVEILNGESSSFAKSGNKDEDRVEFPENKETCEECCFTKQERDIPLSEATDSANEEQSSTSNIDGGELDSSSACLAEIDAQGSCHKLNSDEVFTSSTSKVDGGELDSSSVCLAEIDAQGSCDKLNSDEVVTTSDDQEATKHIDVSLSLEPDNADRKWSDTKLETNEKMSADGDRLGTSKNMAEVDNDQTVPTREVVSSAQLEPLEDAMVARKEENEGDKQESEIQQGSSPTEESEDFKPDVAHDSQFGQQSYMRLWSLVYKHMASSIAAEDGTELNDEANGEKVDGAEVKPETDTSVSSESFPEEDQDSNMKVNNANNERAALLRIETVKLIEKAIDDILLPENQDDSADDQSITSDSIQDQDKREPFISNATDSGNESFKESEKTEQEERATMSSDIPIQEEEQEIAPNKQMSRNWSNLKKMILLKRFIKALENVRKFNPRGPRFLPLEADPEAEKVSLKHQEIDGRKGAEEWMLDYALQQAVVKLTPARKRKVKLLVEAFETVTPTIRT